MPNTKKQTKKPPVKEVSLEDELSFYFREFLETTDAHKVSQTLVNLILTREESEPLNYLDQLNLKSVFYLLDAIHEKTYQRIGAVA